MKEVAFCIGIGITEFRDITPWDLRVALRGYSRRKKDEAEEYQIKFKNEQDLAITQAWLTANWSRAKKMPSLKSVLKSGKKKKKAMTNEEILAQIKALNQILGGEVT